MEKLQDSRTKARMFLYTQIMEEIKKKKNPNLGFETLLLLL